LDSKFVPKKKKEKRIGFKIILMGISLFMVTMSICWGLGVVAEVI